MDDIPPDFDGELLAECVAEAFASGRTCAQTADDLLNAFPGARFLGLSIKANSDTMLLVHNFMREGELADAEVVSLAGTLAGKAYATSEASYARQLPNSRIESKDFELATKQQGCSAVVSLPISGTRPEASQKATALDEYLDFAGVLQLGVPHNSALLERHIHVLTLLAIGLEPHLQLLQHYVQRCCLLVPADLARPCSSDSGSYTAPGETAASVDLSRTAMESSHGMSSSHSTAGSCASGASTSSADRDAAATDAAPASRGFENAPLIELLRVHVPPTMAVGSWSCGSSDGVGSNGDDMDVDEWEPASQGDEDNNMRVESGVASSDELVASSHSLLRALGELLDEESDSEEPMEAESSGGGYPRGGPPGCKKPPCGQHSPDDESDGPSPLAIPLLPMLPAAASGRSDQADGVGGGNSSAPCSGGGDEAASCSSNKEDSALLQAAGALDVGEQPRQHWLWLHFLDWRVERSFRQRAWSSAFLRDVKVTMLLGALLGVVLSTMWPPAPAPSSTDGGPLATVAAQGTWPWHLPLGTALCLLLTRVWHPLPIANRLGICESLLACHALLFCCLTALRLALGMGVPTRPYGLELLLHTLMYRLPLRQLVPVHCACVAMLATGAAVGPVPGLCSTLLLSALPVVFPVWIVAYVTEAYARWQFAERTLAAGSSTGLAHAAGS